MLLNKERSILQHTVILDESVTILRLVSSKKEMGYVFVFVGTPNIISNAKKIGISIGNTLTINTTSEGTTKGFSLLSQAHVNYAGRGEGKSIAEEYFSGVIDSYD